MAGAEHRVVGAALVRDGRVLLGHRRADRALWPDCWDLPGGHVEDGESERAALDRECREELGVVVRRARRVPFTCSDPSVAMVLEVVEQWSGEVVNRAPEEHDALGWFTAAELADLVLADPAYRPVLASILSAP